MTDLPMLPLIFKASFSLLLIVLMICALVYLLKKYTQNASSASSIPILKQISLGHKERIVVLEVEGVKLIIGISPHTFTTLHVIKKNEYQMPV